MSSEGTGSVRKTAAHRTAPGGTGKRNGAVKPDTTVPSSDGHDDGLADPWFAPGPKAEYVDADLAGTDGHSVQGEWFLPTGRAGLLPDSMSDSWDDSDTAQANRGEQTQAAGAPPWGRDSASVAAGEPPPWETGPWPGPGEEATERPRPGATDRGAAGPRAPALGTAEPATDLEIGRERTQRSRLIMIGGAAVVVLIIAIVVIVIATSGGPGTGCATYPAPVQQAYSRAMSDLSSRAPISVQAADLQRAASLANASAAAAGQINARTALFAMASDLNTAYSDVTKHRPVTSDLQQRLAADGTALPRTCPS